ncbi:MAG: hypothetical protein KGK08_04890 [Acidobacteriota bacterium]|nr:hypothetical protein [Acidobacteriota bacterium]
MLTALFSSHAALAQAKSAPEQPLPRFGVQLTVGSLGAGIQAATALAKHTDVRGGFNYFSYSLSGTRSSDNLTYSGTLRLASGELLLDQHFGPFHLSGGALIYNGFQASGNVNVPGGSSFTLNSNTYYSDAADPVTGTGTITVRKAAPEVLIGFGSLLPRSNRHFTFNSDIGVVFQGSPAVALNLLGSTCTTATTGCSKISTNTTAQSDIQAEQTKLNSDLKPFQFYPVLRFGFGYKF